MTSETPYAETEALLAVLNDNDERCNEILRDMLWGELYVFLDKLNHLISLGRDERNRRHRERREQ